VIVINNLSFGRALFNPEEVGLDQFSLAAKLLSLLRLFEAPLQPGQALACLLDFANHRPAQVISKILSTGTHLFAQEDAVYHLVDGVVVPALQVWVFLAEGQDQTAEVLQGAIRAVVGHGLTLTLSNRSEGRLRFSGRRLRQGLMGVGIPIRSLPFICRASRFPL